jgi:hypothetical protein
MMPTVVKEQAPVPPSYQRAQAKQGPALHMNALTLVTTLHLLMVCRMAVHNGPSSLSPTSPTIARGPWRGSAYL